MVALLDILVCPQCKGTLAQVESGQGLLCDKCQMKYPVREGIPVMVLEEAISMRDGGGHLGTPKTVQNSSPSIQGKTVLFKVINGPDQGMQFQLERGSCRALGRSAADTNKTTILNVDWALSIDSETKGLILQYIQKQFRKKQMSAGEEKDQLGAFRRSADVVFTDASLSRLHSMLFFDEIGVGVLDLVSKNGTFVNGKEIESRLLKKSDTIELGETKIIFEG